MVRFIIAMTAAAAAALISYEHSYRNRCCHSSQSDLTFLVVVSWLALCIVSVSLTEH